MSNIYFKIVGLLNAGPITQNPEVYTTNPEIQSAIGGSGGSTPLGNLLSNILRSIGSTIDRGIAAGIDTVFTFLQSLADTDFFGAAAMQTFATRIYVIVALFMLFKLSFSLIKYLIDPEQFSSKDAGFSKMVQKAMIALVLLVLVPFAFDAAFKIQASVLRNQVIERIVFGTATELVEENAKIISYATYSPFNKPNKEVVGDACLGNDLDRCLDAIEAAADPAEALAIRNTYEDAVTRQDAQSILSNNLLLATTTSNQYVFDYGSIFNFLAGLAVLLIIISFCFDIAIRSVKLSFLKLIAPIPIIASIDPKSDIFNKWLKNTLGTYADLFIRLLAVYFALFVISLVNYQMLYSFSDGSEVEASGILIFFVVVGSLLFAKQLPKLISDITGLKIEGGFTLNPMARIAQVPVLGKALSIGEGVIAGGISGGLAGRETGQTASKALHGMLTGGNSAAKDTSWAGSKDFKDPHSFSKGFQGAYKNITGNEKAIFGLSQIQSAINPKATDKLTAPWKEQSKGYEKQTDKLDDIYKRMGHERENAWDAGDEEFASEITKRMQDNRTQHKDITKKKKLVDNQIETIKKRNQVDESPTKKLRELETAETIEREVDSKIDEWDTYIKSKRSQSSSSANNSDNNNTNNPGSNNTNNTNNPGSGPSNGPGTENNNNL